MLPDSWYCTTVTFQAVQLIMDGQFLIVANVLLTLIFFPHSRFSTKIDPENDGQMGEGLIYYLP